MTFRINVVFFCIVFFSTSGIIQALDLTKVNLNYQYDPREVTQMSHRVMERNDSLFVYLNIETDSLSRWNSSFLLQNGYSSVTHDTLKDFSIDTLYNSVTKGIFRIGLQTRQVSLLIVVLGDFNEGKYRVEDITIKNPKGFPSFVPVNEEGLPIMTNYVVDEEIKLEGGNQFHVFQYTENFGPADPAMGSMKPIAPMLDIDSSFFIGQSLSMVNRQFYLIQTDSLSENAITLLKCAKYYPEFKKLDELISPLTYITTANEIEALTTNASKKSFENFWVNTYGTKFRAKKAIRVFYDQVNAANAMFTDYRQGWKTDRGLLYIIFGRPDFVIRDEQKEIWKYIDGIEFEFIRIPTLFTPFMYSLRRDKKYEKIWYSEVGSIRNGL